MRTPNSLSHKKYSFMIAALVSLLPQPGLAAAGAVDSDPGYGLLVGALVFGLLGALLLGLGALASRRFPGQPPASEQ